MINQLEEAFGASDHAHALKTLIKLAALHEHMRLLATVRGDFAPNSSNQISFKTGALAKLKRQTLLAIPVRENHRLCVPAGWCAVRHVR
jgi:hypothetical protein